MNIARHLRLTITKFVRFWNPAIVTGRLCIVNFFKKSRFVLEPFKEFIKPIGEKQQTDDVNEPLPESKSAQRRQPDASRKEEKLTTWQRIEHIIRFIEGFAFLAAIITAVYIGAQWHEMVKASDISNKQLNVMQGQLDEGKRTRVLDERAWVGAFHVIFENGRIESTHSEFRVEFQNTGKTPAMKVSAFIDAHDFVPVNWDVFVDKPHARMQTNWLSYSGMLMPNAIGSVTTAEIDNTTEKSINEGMPYYVYGKIWYDDIFGQRHWSEFCYLILLPNFTALPVTPHNTCDDAQTSQTNQ